MRREVFKLLLKHDITFHAVVKNKQDLASFVQQKERQNPEYKFRERDLYETLTCELFGRLRKPPDVLNLVFSSRGNITRNEALRDSLKKADDFFAERFGFRRIQIVAPSFRECVQQLLVDTSVRRLHRNCRLFD